MTKSVEEGLAELDAGLASIARWPRVRGRCPACGSEALIVADDGYITCSWLSCPEPDAVTDILDGECHHIVTFDENAFVVRHPLIERIHGRMEDCGLHAWLRGLAGPPVQLGSYRVRLESGTNWQTATWERVS